MYARWRCSSLRKCSPHGQLSMRRGRNTLVASRSNEGQAMRVALFITCFNDTLFPEVGINLVRLLERLGIDVEFPEEQTCCGQMHFNTGYQRESIPLARHFVSTF